MTKPDVVTKSKGKTSGLSLGIGPISLPKYLNRPQIVTRASRHSLMLAEFHKWAEQLEVNFSHVVAENLSILLSTDRVELFPWKRQRSIDYQVVMDVIQFDRNPGGEALLLARWSLMDGKGQPVVMGKKSRVTVNPKGQDYESLVEALSETLTGTIDDFKERRFVNLTGTDAEIELWTSDQGFAEQDRYVCRDLNLVLQAARYYSCCVRNPQDVV